MFFYFNHFKKLFHVIYSEEAVLTKKLRMFFKVMMLLTIRWAFNVTNFSIFLKYLTFLNSKLLLGENICIKGVKYYINDYLSLLVLSPFHEKQTFLCMYWEIKKLLLLKDQAVMIDIGAHIGKYALTFSRLFPSLKILAIEPCPNNFFMLRKSITVNNLKNIIPLKVACTDKDENVCFYVSFKSDVHSLIKNSETVASIVVEGKKLDSLVSELNLKSVDIIKIDVEEAEYEVLKGGLNTIKKAKPIIFLEIWPNNYQKIFEFLRKLQYNILWVEDNNYVAIPTSV